MKFRILPSGSLQITADNRDREELAYDLRRGARDSAESFVNEFTDGGALCALTDAPLIAQDMTGEDDGSRAFYGKVWKHEGYMFTDYLEQLAWKGRVVFTLGADFGEQAYRVPAPGTPEYSELSAHNYEHCLD